MSNAVMKNIPSFIILLPLQMKFTGTNRRFLTGVFPEPGICFASVLCGCRTKGMCTEDAILLAGKFLSHSIGDTMKENTPGRDGVNFEKFLIDLIADSNV